MGSLLSTFQRESVFGSNGVYRGLAQATKKSSKKTQTKKSKTTKKKPTKKRKPQAAPKITDPRIETKLSMCLQLMEESASPEQPNEDAPDPIKTSQASETSNSLPMTGEPSTVGKLDASESTASPSITADSLTMTEDQDSAPMTEEQMMVRSTNAHPNSPLTAEELAEAAKRAKEYSRRKMRQHR